MVRDIVRFPRWRVARDDEDDLVQGVMTALFDGVCRRGVPLRKNLMAFASGIAHNKLVDYVRRRREECNRRVELDPEQHVDRGPIPDEEHRIKAKRDCIKRALEALDPRCRELLAEKYPLCRELLLEQHPARDEKVKSKDLAKRYGITPGGMGRKLYDCRQEFIEQLKRLDCI